MLVVQCLMWYAMLRCLKNGRENVQGNTCMSEESGVWTLQCCWFIRYNTYQLQCKINQFFCEGMGREVGITWWVRGGWEKKSCGWRKGEGNKIARRDGNGNKYVFRRRSLLGSWTLSREMPICAMRYSSYDSGFVMRYRHNIGGMSCSRRHLSANCHHFIRNCLHASQVTN